MPHESDPSTMTLDQANRAEDRLFEWAREHGPTITLSAMLVTGAGELAGIPEPHGFVIGSVGDMSELDIAILLVQLETLLLVTLASVASTAVMGEDAFRAAILKYRKIMQEREDIEVCVDCEDEFPRLLDGGEA